MVSNSNTDIFYNIGTPSDKNQLEKHDIGTSDVTHMQEATPKSHSSTIAEFVTKSDIYNSALNFSVITRGSDWIIDLGATDHMTCDPHKFTNFLLIVPKLLLLMPMGSHLLLKV